jgi:hypothetical protein
MLGGHSIRSYIFGLASLANTLHVRARTNKHLHIPARTQTRSR